MSTVRSLCIMFSLAFMLLGGIFTPAPVSAAAEAQRGVVVQTQQEYRVTSAAEARMNLKAAQDAGTKMTVTTSRSSVKGPGDIISPDAGVFYRVNPQQAQLIVADTIDGNIRIVDWGDCWVAVEFDLGIFEIYTIISWCDDA